MYQKFLQPWKQISSLKIPELHLVGAIECYNSKMMLQEKQIKKEKAQCSLLLEHNRRSGMGMAPMDTSIHPSTLRATPLIVIPRLNLLTVGI